MKSTLFAAIFQPGKGGLRAPFENRNCLASLLLGELLSLFLEGRGGIWSDPFVLGELRKKQILVSKPFCLTRKLIG